MASVAMSTTMPHHAVEYPWRLVGAVMSTGIAVMTGSGGESGSSVQVHVGAPGPDEQGRHADHNAEDADHHRADEQAEEEDGDPQGDEERHVRLVRDGHGRFRPAVDAGGDR